MLAIKLVIYILLLVVISSFSVINMGEVEINYYDWSFHEYKARIPLFWVICGSFASGLLLAWLSNGFKNVKLKSNLRKSSRTIDGLNQELDKHREKEAA
jgi:uncharacterized integral membrane protein|tara:strand:+ start:204 stop:500 length:297 start_codon:yes stop_codon:yes gene_type:complete